MGVSKSPSYLVRHRNILYARVSVPKSLRARLGRAEYRFSLGTSYFALARPCAQKLAAVGKELFTLLATGNGPMSTMTDHEMRALVYGWLQKTLQECEEFRLTARAIDPDQLEINLDAMSDYRSGALEALAYRQYQSVRGDVDKLLSSKNIEGITSSSREYTFLCRELLKARVEVADQQLQMDLGNYPPQNITPQPISNNRVSPVLLSDAIEAFIKEKTEDPKMGWTRPSSQQTNIPIIQLFGELVGTLSVYRLTKEHIKEYKAKISSLPARRTVLKRYRKYTLEQLLNMEIPNKDKLDDRTISNYYRVVGSFLKWASNEYNISSGLDSLLSIKLTKAPNSARDPFTADDLKTLFYSPYYTEDKFSDKQSHYFWVPLIALFSGMRLEEICQLHLDDIYEDDGVWVFDLNNNDGKSLKNNTSIRKVPIHPRLVTELNFLSFVRKQRKTKTKRLFPNLNLSSKNKYGDRVQKWFDDTYKRKLNIKDDPAWKKKTFHSFRMTFETLCNNELGIPPYQYQVVVGQSPTGLTDVAQHYVKHPKPKSLLDDVISKVDFDIDLSPLKTSRFVN